MIAYHGTDEHDYLGILDEGFNLTRIKNSRRFGDGVYFSDQPDVSYYGDSIVVAEIKEEKIAHFPRKEWQRIEDSLIHTYQHSYTQYIPGYVNKLGFSCLCIDWDGRGKELVVFDLTAIEILSPKGEK